MTQISSETFFHPQQSGVEKKQYLKHRDRSFDVCMTEKAAHVFPGNETRKAQQFGADVNAKEQMGDPRHAESELTAEQEMLFRFRDSAFEGKGHSTLVERAYRNNQRESQIAEDPAAEDFHDNAISQDIDVLAVLSNRGNEAINTGNFIHQLVATGQFDNILVIDESGDIPLPSLHGDTELNRSNHQMLWISTGFQPLVTGEYSERISSAPSVFAERVFWRGKSQQSARAAFQTESVMDASYVRKPVVSEDFTKTLLKTFIEPDKIRVCFRDYAGQTHKESLMKLIQALHAQSSGPVFFTHNGVTEVHYGNTTRG
ncbi:hypothetical protein KDD30_05245 [Photobacterium sp. GJ3]|uniref:hypothetical protein n=1 Tax=Photobacterium sp. GJ3 TaxID=2829502 RepID=UPI001B8AD59C|nr:hypothetical protein [Photobacterium sp. GJ3]QUJ68521.1 hypothetical protein KDD30_05245 [Photobacterium sp. GJ3]